MYITCFYWWYIQNREIEMRETERVTHAMFSRNNEAFHNILYCVTRTQDMIAISQYESVIVT